MVTRTPGPFQYYDELFSGHGSITGDTIRASAQQPGEDAATIAALAHELHQDEQRTAGQIEGQIKTAVAHAPMVVKDRAAALGASGMYAIGLINQFATYVDDFDTSVNSINVEYHHQMSVMRATALGQPLHDADVLLSMLLAPQYGVNPPPTYTGDPLLIGISTPQPAPTFDATGVGAQVQAGLRPRYQTAHTLLDTHAETIATKFKQGPTAANVHDLVLNGEIPLSAAFLYPGLRFTTDELRKALALDPAFSNIPSVTDPRFQSWFAGLTPFQRQMAILAMQVGFPPKDFNPLSTIKPGAMPAWTQQYQCGLNGLMPFATTSNGTYGYFGGGSILGPGGAQWPIVMPYLQQGDHIYMADDGQGRSDGGIYQLDGNDPGWTTVATYSGLNNFGHISATTKTATIFLIATGQELETTQTDPGAVRIGPDGRAYAGHDVTEIPQSPTDKAYWDIESETMMPEGSSKYLGPLALADQAGMAAQAAHNEDSHTSRQWYVSYEVNDDGRTRAVVHTYSATPTEDDKTYVGSFANSFPDGNGKTEEIPYNTRYNDYSQPVMIATPDDHIEYSGRGEPLDNSTPITENMTK
ncbi:MAG TPA: hypothetical protein VN088_16575 [Nocardioides sp.]|nr:hypothetical protein [Nocardioides sp.]